MELLLKKCVAIDSAKSLQTVMMSYKDLFREFL